jgi:hypothetical protein
MYKKRIFIAVVLSYIVAVTLIVCWPLVQPVYARTIGLVSDKLGNYTGPLAGTALDDNVKGALDLIDSKVMPSANATNWYVDSGVSGTAGTDWTTAVSTIEGAVALASAEDWIHVAPGHNEGISVDSAIDFDKAGLVIKGYGFGAKKPTIDYDLPAGGMNIGADSITIMNLRFRVSANAVSHAIDVEAAGDNFLIKDCEFGYAETATDEFTAGIVIAGTANDGRIEGCWFDSGGQAAASAVSFGAVVGLHIVDNQFMGDYSTAVITNNTGAADNVWIKGNDIFSGTMAGDGEINTTAPISVLNNTAGFIVDNNLVGDTSNVLTLAVADDMTFMYNKAAHTDGDEFEGTLRSAGTAVTASPGSG